MQQDLTGAVLKEFGYARSLILKVLETIPKTRDMNDDDFKQYIHSYCIVYDLETPRSETIRRTRQKIQNTEGLFQASEEVQAIKKAREKAIEENLRFF